MNRAFVNVLTHDVEKSAAFYETLLHLHRHADFGWFVILTHPDMPGFEMGILNLHHETVPQGIGDAPSRVILTFVVDDVSETFLEAERLGATIIEPPRDMPYGQRRLMVRDPAGTMIDISSPISV